MRDKMKKWFIIALMIVLAFTVVGCGGRKIVKEPNKVNREDDNHIVFDKDKDIKVAASNQPKNMKGMIPANKESEGYVVITILVKVTNHSQQPLQAKPTYVTIFTDKGNTYQFDPTDAVVLTSRAFLEKLVPGNDGEGGGILPFEVKSDEKVTKLNYKDEAGHDINLEYNKPAAKV